MDAETYDDDDDTARPGPREFGAGLGSVLRLFMLAAELANG